MKIKIQTPWENSLQFRPIGRDSSTMAFNAMAYASLSYVLPYLAVMTFFFLESLQLLKFNVIVHSRTQSSNSIYRQSYMFGTTKKLLILKLFIYYMN